MGEIMLWLVSFEWFAKLAIDEHFSTWRLSATAAFRLTYLYDLCSCRWSSCVWLYAKVKCFGQSLINAAGCFLGTFISLHTLESWNSIPMLKHKKGKFCSVSHASSSACDKRLAHICIYFLLLQKYRFVSYPGLVKKSGNSGWILYLFSRVSLLHTF